MNITSVNSSTQSIWEDIRQESMRNSQKNIPASVEQDNAASAVPAAPAAASAAASTDPDDIDGDGVVTALERVKAMQRRAKMAGAPQGAETTEEPATRSTPLENVGPNTYEKMKMSAGRTYLSQLHNYGGAAAAATELDTSA